jgi:glycosyltransferase involved in cell wall biosynthesis
VLGDIPSLREIWLDAALFVPPGDKEALQTALAALINDRQLRTALAARARRRANEFTAERMAAGYMQAYGELMRSNRTADKLQQQTGLESELLAQSYQAGIFP